MLYCETSVLFVIACGGHSLITLEQPLSIYKFTALQKRKAQFFFA
jgi:hypothetical protein